MAYGFDPKKVVIVVTGILKAFSYVLILILNVIGALYFPTALAYFLPILFILLPLILQKTIHLRPSPSDLLIGIGASLLVFIPLLIYKLLKIGSINLPPFGFVFVTYLLVALPEEAFFRGMLMDSIGLNWKGVFISSLLFALAHGHRYFLYGDYLAFFTFFPSLIMGYLYMKTRNILAPTVFHGSSNVALFAVM